jgi:hypothetical protein
MEPHKITLVGWVDRALEQPLTFKKSSFGFGATCIWPCNPKVMNSKIQPSQIYIADPINDQEIESYITYDEADQNQNSIVENPPF